MEKSDTRQPRRFRGGFTLAELLVAMAIIAVLAAITVVAVGQIASDAKLSSGTNAVIASLDNARALALRTNRPVLVVFRPVADGNQQRVEAVTAEFTGESFVGGLDLYDRFAPIEDVPVRALPRGVGVAGPFYGSTGATPFGRRADTLWVTQSTLRELPAEAPGRLIGVLYGPDGATMTRNPLSDSSGAWVDFENEFDSGLGDFVVTWDLAHSDPDLPDSGSPWLFDHPEDETIVSIVPFIAVYDDADAREVTGALGWDDDETRTLQLSDYITDRSDRIHFNRYTGVVMR
jgi:prepilin-type N-terminal cleavage/methylation domain-containing protein